MKAYCGISCMVVNVMYQVFWIMHNNLPFLTADHTKKMFESFNNFYKLLWQQILMSLNMCIPLNRIQAAKRKVYIWMFRLFRHKINFSLNSEWKGHQSKKKKKKTPRTNEICWDCRFSAEKNNSLLLNPSFCNCP